MDRPPKVLYLHSHDTMDDSPSKDLLMRHGLAERPVAATQLYDLVFVPQEAANLSGSPEHAEIEAALAGRLDAWMRETDDPLLAGPVAPPPGVELNDPDQSSAADPTTRY